MKLDLDCIRDLMITLESEITYNDNLMVNRISLDNILKSDLMKSYDRKTVFYTAKKLDEAGYIDFEVQYASGSVFYAAFNNLTYAGHQFLEDIRSPKVWEETKSTASKVGSFSINLISQIAGGIVLAAANKYLGLNM